MRPQTLLMQRTLWLKSDDSDLDRYGGLIMPEQSWLATDGYSNAVLLATVFSLGDECELLLEGTDEPAGGWNLISAVSSPGSTGQITMLTPARPRSATANRLWRFVRGRWAPEDTATGTLASQDICFKIKAVLKP